MQVAWPGVQLTAGFSPLLTAVHSASTISPVYGNSKCHDTSPNGIFKEEVHFAHHNAIL